MSDIYKSPSPPLASTTAGDTVQRSPALSRAGEKSQRYRDIRAALDLISYIELPIILLMMTAASGYYTYHGALALNSDIFAAQVNWDNQQHALILSVAVTGAL